MAPQPRRLLVVEDSPLILERLLRFIDGMTELKVVGVSATAADAIAKIEQERPEILLLDIALNEGDGFQVLEALRNKDMVRDTVMITNYANPFFRARASALGVNHFFDKSTEFERALRCLSDLASTERKSES